MSSKPKIEAKVSVLKGSEAEDTVLEYMKRMNRPYGAVDVSANLKGAVPKTATQKILLALAEKGELVQKIYGKSTFFVVNQANIDSVPAEKIEELKTQAKGVDEENKLLAAELKSATSELGKIKGTPTDDDIQIQTMRLLDSIKNLTAQLLPLRAGAPQLSVEDRARLDAEWAKWRGEWVNRKRVFKNFWELASDALPPHDAEVLREDLGIELDSPEHVALEMGPLCAANSNPLKRKR